MLLLHKAEACRLINRDLNTTLHIGTVGIDVHADVYRYPDLKVLNQRELPGIKKPHRRASGVK